jgi:undecaprenyl-diphosphatase
VAPVAWAMVLGGVAIFAIEAYTERKPKSEAAHVERCELGRHRADPRRGVSRHVTLRRDAVRGDARGDDLAAGAAEFSFLLAIPTMFAATAYEVLNLYRHDQIAQENWTDLGVGFVVSAIVAFIAVKWLLTYIQTHRFTIFAWYRIIAGIALPGPRSLTRSAELQES